MSMSLWRPLKLRASMDLRDLDLFDTYRWLLAMVCTVYAAVITWRSVWPWLVWFGTSRETEVIGRYALVLLLRTRLRRHTWQLAQIAVLSAAFLWIVHLHHKLGVN